MADLSWDEVHAGLARASRKAGEWAGYPMPIEGMSMTVHPSYPFSENLSKTFLPKPSLRVCHDSDVNEDVELRNSWSSYKDRWTIQIWRDGKKFLFTRGSRVHAAPMVLQTLGAARSWDFAAELRAQETLKRHLTEWAYQCYIMTGTFLETSPRSHVSYMFRRLRPTIAMTGRPTRKGDDVGMRILTCLCLHPVGFFNGTFAGALVPSDDVLAHLLMMRGCEAKFWAHANHHDPLSPEAGL